MSAWGVVREHPLKFGASMLVSLVLLYFAFRGLDWQAFWAAIREIRIFWLAAAALLLFASNILRAIRWGILLSPQRVVSVWELFQITFIGYLGNDVLPLKLGEALRAVILAKRQRIPFTGAFGSIVVERGLDMFSFFLLVGLFALLSPELLPNRIIPALGLAGLVLILLFAAWMNRKQSGIFRRVELWISRQESSGRRKLAEQLLAFLRGIATIWQMPRPGVVLVNTFLLWLVYYAVTFCGLVAFDMQLGWQASLNATMVFMAFTTFSMGVPSAPGYVGTYHGAGIAALLLFGVEENLARAFAVVMHLLNYVVYAPTGGIFLLNMGIHLDVLEENPPGENLSDAPETDA